MNEATEIVLASNRGPITFVRTKGGFETKRGAGGLAGALDPVARALGHRAAWIAATTSQHDREALHEGAADGLAETLGYPVYLLDIPPETYARYYDMVSNRMLWFAHHCLFDEVTVEHIEEGLTDYVEAYAPVNERFARAVCEVAETDALVLFQDYHLATAPAALRALRPQQPIFHFTHSSFCGTEGLNRLPREISTGIISGMLGADLLGFHVARWVHAFLDAAEWMGAEVDRTQGAVRHDGRTTWVREYPIQIEAASLSERASGESAGAWHGRFDELAGEGRLVVRADRIEPSKNIIRGFEAFEQLLDKRPELARDTRFAACIYPSRASMPEYQRYRVAIIETAERICKRFPDVVHLYLEDDFDRTLGALRRYDVLLVNPLMDGMNLVAKEGPLLNQNDGVLVLSAGAGSAEEMAEGAVMIEDATDIAETAAALERALDMDPRERRERAQRLRSDAVRAAPERWIDDQVQDLQAILRSGSPLSAPC